MTSTATRRPTHRLAIAQATARRLRALAAATAAVADSGDTELVADLLRSHAEFAASLPEFIAAAERDGWTAADCHDTFAL